MRVLVSIAMGIGLLLAATLPAFADVPATAPAAYATPADVFNAAVKAGRGGEIPTFVACFSSDGKAQYVRFFLTMLVSSSTTGPATRPADPALAQFLARYGITDLSRRPGET
ncbi:MAG TPA: hypothetical protein VHY37_13735, partial [Tepidisphaeraceae bacterium]|nr:hypothetical protein [Tepidisphaeraceae bacterium]